MAPTLITVLPISRFALAVDAAVPPACDSVNGNYCYNDGATLFEMLNQDAGTRTVSITVVNGVDGLTAGPRVYTLPISALKQWAGPFPVRYYGTTLLFTAASSGVKIQPWSALGP